jgi:flagellar biosynthetic protein FlhB
VSENSDKDSKTFDPTPRRIQQARDEGNVAKSKEVPTALVMLAAGIACVSTGSNVMQALVKNASQTFRFSARAGTDLTAVMDVFVTSCLNTAFALLPFVLLITLAAVMGHIGQTGILISPKALAPKMDRINPFKKIKEVLSPTQAGMRTGVALLKMFFVGIVVTLVIAQEAEHVLNAYMMEPAAMLTKLGGAVVKTLLSAGISFVAIALIDFAWQRYSHNKKLKMTREEVKREQKEDEGSPEVKGRRKQMYRELTLNRVMDEVPRADVIVTNPTHFAVALRYEAGQDVAPRVVAKGIDAMALTIRRIARQNSVPIIENRALARSLHKQVKVGHPVPTDLFQAVAEVLAHVYQIKRRLAGGDS